MFIFLQMAGVSRKGHLFLIWNQSIESSGSLDEPYGKFSSTLLLVPHLRGKEEGEKCVLKSYNYPQFKDTIVNIYLQLMLFNTKMWQYVVMIKHRGPAVRWPLLT